MCVSHAISISIKLFSEGSNILWKSEEDKFRVSKGDPESIRCNWTYCTFLHPFWDCNQLLSCELILSTQRRIPTLSCCAISGEQRSASRSNESNFISCRKISTDDNKLTKVSTARNRYRHHTNFSSKSQEKYCSFLRLQYFQSWTDAVAREQ